VELVLIALAIAFVIGFVALLVFASRHHRRTWGDTKGVEAKEDREPKVWLGQGHG